MSNFGGRIPLFLEELLGNYETAIPRGAQWVLHIENLDEIKDTVVRTIREYEPTGWNIEESLNTLLNKKNLLDSKGCFFAQAVEIPEESIVTVPYNFQYNGFLRSSTGEGRNTPTGIRIAFLETNYSFVELFVRPWVITTGHLGLIQIPELKYRTNINVFKLGTFQHTTAPTILRSYTFHDACPITVTGEEYNYTQATGPTIHETTFLYNYYTIDGPRGKGSAPDPGLPLATPNRNIVEYLAGT